MSPLDRKTCAHMQESHIDLTVDAEQHAGLVRSVRGQVPGISREDAEDAVQDAWIVLAEKAERLKSRDRSVATCEGPRATRR